MGHKTSVTSVFGEAVAKIKDLLNYGGEKPAKKEPKKRDGIFNKNTRNLLKKVDN